MKSGLASSLLCHNSSPNHTDHKPAGAHSRCLQVNLCCLVSLSCERLENITHRSLICGDDDGVKMKNSLLGLKKTSYNQTEENSWVSVLVCLSLEATPYTLTSLYPGCVCLSTTLLSCLETVGAVVVLYNYRHRLSKHRPQIHLKAEAAGQKEKTSTSKYKYLYCRETMRSDKNQILSHTDMGVNKSCLQNLALLQAQTHLCVCQ